MIKKVCSMYFSGTGTTERTVKTIASKLGEELNAEVETFDFTFNNARKFVKKFDENYIVVFGMPVIAGRVPNLMLKYLDTIEGNGALVVPVVLYGNRNYDDALIELRDILVKDGFKAIAAGAFIGEHSFSTILGKSRPDSKDLDICNDFAKKIAAKIKSDDFDRDKEISVKGNQPYKPYYTPRDSKGTAIDIRKVKPITNEKCIDCKLCAVICPMGAISFDNVREVPGICMKCCACVKKCPVGAKYYDDPNYLYHQHELEAQYMARKEPELFL